jgi:hypothetical protein
MFFDEENATFNCHWLKPPPSWSKKKARQILAEYEPWRNSIIEAWAERNNKKVMVVSL